MSNSLIPSPAEPGQYGPPFAEEFTPPQSKFRWSKYLTALRSFWWIPTLTLLVGVSGAVVHFFKMPPLYISTAALWEGEKLRLPDGASFSEDSQNFLGTQSELLKSENLRSKALKILESARTVEIPKDPLDEPAEVKIRVSQAPKSTVFWVEATGANPAFTPAYLDALIQVYLEYKQQARQETTLGTLNSLSKQVREQAQKLRLDQEAFAEFQRTNDLGAFEQDKAAAVGYLSKLKGQLSDYELERSLLDAALLERSIGPGDGTNALSLGSQLNPGARGTAEGDSGMASRKQIELLKMEREHLSRNLRPQHPKIAKLDEEIERAQKQLEIYSQQTQQQISVARQALEIKIAGVKVQIDEWESRLVEANARVSSADVLRQELDRGRDYYRRLVNLLDNVDIGRNTDRDTLTVLQPASPAKRSFKAALNVLLASLVLGAGCGLGLVWLVAVRDDRFSTIMEVTENLGDAVVGQVPELPQPKKGQPLALLEQNDDRHIYAESYRSLRSALLFLAAEGDRPKVLLVTSAVPNEGKSTIATNLARSLALGGSRVLLVDGDLRKGHLHQLLELECKPGLSEALQQPESLEKLIQTNSLANFHFLSRGSVPANPGDLILNSAFDEMLGRLREQFDYVVIDSSPVFAADDASTLAPKVDGTLFVVRSQFSRTKAVREAMDLLLRRQARVLGVVLNRTDASARSYYYYKYSDYYRQDAATAAH